MSTRTVAARLSYPLATLLLLSSMSCEENPDVIADPNVGSSGSSNLAPTSQPVCPGQALVNELIHVTNEAVDPDGTITLYRFRSEFQDFTKTDKIASLVFPQAGAFHVWVSARDDQELWGSEVPRDILIEEPPIGHETVYFLDDGTRDVDVVWTVTGTPPHASWRISQYNGIRTLTVEGKGGLALGSGYIPAPVRDARLKMRIQLKAEYIDPHMNHLSDDFREVRIEVHYNDAQHRGLGFVFFYARTVHPREGSFGFMDPPERRYPSHVAMERLANGGWLTIDVDLERLVLSRLPGIVDLDLVQSLSVVVYHNDTYGRGEEFRSRIDIDEIKMYVP